MTKEVLACHRVLDRQNKGGGHTMHHMGAACFHNTWGGTVWYELLTSLIPSPGGLSHRGRRVPDAVAGEEPQAGGDLEASSLRG